MNFGPFSFFLLFPNLWLQSSSNPPEHWCACKRRKIVLRVSSGKDLLPEDLSRMLAPSLSTAQGSVSGCERSNFTTSSILFGQSKPQTLANGVQPRLSLALGLTPFFLRSRSTTRRFPLAQAMKRGVRLSLSGRSTLTSSRSNRRFIGNQLAAMMALGVFVYSLIQQLGHGAQRQRRTEEVPHRGGSRVGVFFPLLFCFLHLLTLVCSQWPHPA